MSMKVEVEDARVISRLRELQRRLENPAPVMEEISVLMQAGVDETFENEADPVTGVPWDPLKPATIRKRQKINAWPGKILQVQGDLAKSFVPSSGTDFAAVGSNHLLGKGPYGADVLHFGNKDGTLPPRHILGLSEDVQEDILELLSRYLD